MPKSDPQVLEQARRLYQQYRETDPDLTVRVRIVRNEIVPEVWRSPQEGWVPAPNVEEVQR